MDNNKPGDSTIAFIEYVYRAVNASYSLPESEKKLLYAMINNSPQAFHEIDKTVLEILKDGKVDLHDIPNIVLLVSQIFKANINIKNVDLTGVVKFVVHVLLDFLPIPAMELPLAKKLADTSIDLLAMTLNTMEEYVEKACCAPSNNKYKTNKK